jgi:hypothetical protein
VLDRIARALMLTDVEREHLFLLGLGRPPEVRYQAAGDVRTYGEGVKHLRHPIAGPIAFEYSAFAVDGRPDLGMVIYHPATSADADRIRSLIKSRTCASVRPPHNACSRRQRLDHRQEIGACLPKTSSSASKLAGRSVWPV